MSDETDDRDPAKGGSANWGKQFRKMRSLLAKQARRPAAVTEDHVLSILAYRRARATAFGRDLFSDPAWDMLLELFAAHLGDRRVRLCELARSIAVPTSTARRWAAALAEHGLVVFTAEPRDQGPVVVDLSVAGASAMKRMMAYWGAAFRSI